MTLEVVDGGLSESMRDIVKKELGLPVTESLAADPKLSLLRIKK